MWNMNHLHGQVCDKHTHTHTEINIIFCVDNAESQLTEWQQLGADFFLNLLCDEKYNGGILADEMGMGKTGMRLCGGFLCNFHNLLIKFSSNLSCNNHQIVGTVS